MIKPILFSGTAALALLTACAMAHAQSIDTRIGKLELHNGYPSKATVEKLYDESDIREMRGYIVARAQPRHESRRLGRSLFWPPEAARALST